MWPYIPKLYRPFRYFMILINASTKWSHVSLLSNCGGEFARLLGQIIRLRALFSDYPIKKIRLKTVDFNNYCMSIGVDVEHLIAHTHTQNGLVESLIKHT